MKKSYPPLSVRIWGNFACFTRPENKVERVSYRLPTPSAARGILESIFWKPEFQWQVTEIHVLKPIRTFSIVRNEIGKRQTIDGAKKGGFAISENMKENRFQRHTLMLRDVAYVITAQMILQPHADTNIAKYRDQFRRRVKKGQCFTRPYLGCREFAAHFDEVNGSEVPIELTEDLGRMLHDLRYDENGSGRGTPVFFHAKLKRGVLNIPPMEKEYASTEIG